MPAVAARLAAALHATSIHVRAGSGKDKDPSTIVGVGHRPCSYPSDSTLPQPIAYRGPGIRSIASSHVLDPRIGWAQMLRTEETTIITSLSGWYEYLGPTFPCLPHGQALGPPFGFPRGPRMMRAWTQTLDDCRSILERLNLYD